MTTNPAPGPAAPAKNDFFISYNKADRQMAEWIAWQLEDAGHSVVIEAWDFMPGGNFALEMDRALEACERVIAVLSADYFGARFTHPEWAAYFARDPTGEAHSVIPVRVGEFSTKGLLGQIIYIDLLGQEEDAARAALLAGVAGARTGRGKPARAPAYRPRAAGAPPSFPAPAAAGGSGLLRHQLPPHPPVFLGREEEVAQLSAHLAQEGAQGAAITGSSLQGMGGVGKTALAVVLAHRVAARYPDAQLYRDLRGADAGQQPLTPAEVMRDFILALRPDAGQLPEEPGQLGGIYRAVLSEAGRVLVLLDNAADAAQVRPLLPPAGCLLLVTSRQHFTLPGLAVRNLDCLAPDKAAELLQRLAPRVAEHAAEAARLCGGLPLALEVFAGAINDQSLTDVPELLARLQAGEEKLEPVDAAFEVSQSLLPEETRAAWHTLAIFTASFDLPAAAAVWEKEPAAARATLQALVNASLVEWDEGKARFRLHDLARQFCEGRLPAAAREEARLRHARHYIAVAEESQELYLQGGAQVLAGLQLFDRERTHIEASFAWLQTRADVPSAKLLVSLVNAVAYVVQLRFHPRRRIAWPEAQCAAARLIGDRRAEGYALANLGLAHSALGDARKAIEFYEQRLVIAREFSDRRGESAALGNLGGAYYDLGDARKAIEFHEQDRDIAREIGDRRGEGQALNNLGLAYKDLGDARKAIEFYEQSLVVKREIGDRYGEGNALGNLANAYYALGDAHKAIEFYDQILVLHREIGDRRGEGQDLGNLGNAYAALGDARKAIEFYEQRLVIAREIGDRRGEGYASFNMANQLWPAGERTRALELMETAWQIWTAIESPDAADAGALLQEWREEMGGGAPPSRSQS
ncbi:MAG TPA: TIR domain-containing protein [Chthoniobacteraceae bacterium]|jgi:tetratricopeptide (TPR) repeat protein|nr:TIR domain-containing protein [Chthoniobacteraceae bacterium]